MLFERFGFEKTRVGGFEITGTSLNFEKFNTFEYFNILESFGWALIHSLWQGCLAALIVIGFRGLLKNSAPALRYGIQCLALISVLLAFIVTFMIYHTGTRIPVGSITKLALTFPLPSQLALPALDSFSSEASPIGPVDQFSLVGDLSKLTPIIAFFWALGFIYLMLRYSAAYLLTRKLRKTGLTLAPAVWSARFSTLLLNTGVSSKVELFISAHITSPMTLGFFKPVVLVPVSFFTGLPNSQIEAVLLHEIAHIRRHDYLINLMQIVIKSLFFFHPAVHYISRKIEEDREQACDDIAVAQTGNPRALAKALATLRLMQKPQTPRIAQNLSMAAIGQKETALVTRLKRLVEEDTLRGKPEHLVLSVITVLFATTLGLSAAPLKAIAAERTASPSDLFLDKSQAAGDDIDPIFDHEKTLTLAKLAKPLPVTPSLPPTPAAAQFIPVSSVPPVAPKIVRTAHLGHSDTALVPELAGAPVRQENTADQAPKFEYVLREFETEMNQVQRMLERLKFEQGPELTSYLNTLEKQIQNQIDSEMRVIVKHASAQAEAVSEMQIKQTERQMKATQRRFEQTHREAESTRRQIKFAEASAERASERVEERAADWVEDRIERQFKQEEKQREKAKERAQRTHAEMSDAPDFEIFKQDLTQRLLTDGHITSLSDTFKITFENGHLKLNGTNIPEPQLSEYCNLLSTYKLQKSEQLEICARPDTFTIKSGSLEGHSERTIEIGTYTLDELHSDEIKKQSCTSPT